MRKLFIMTLAALSLALAAPVTASASPLAQGAANSVSTGAPAKAAVGEKTDNEFSSCRCYRRYYRVRYYRVYRYYPRYRYRYHVRYYVWRV